MERENNFGACFGAGGLSELVGPGREDAGQREVILLLAHDARAPLMLLLKSSPKCAARWGRERPESWLLVGLVITPRMACKSAYSSDDR